MQIMIADKIYRDIEAAIGRQDGDVPKFIEQVLARLASRLQNGPSTLPEELQAAVDTVRQRGGSKPPTGPEGEAARSQFKSSLETLQSSFSEADPGELQQWIDQAVDEVEDEFRQRAIDAHPA